MDSLNAMKIFISPATSYWDLLKIEKIYMLFFARQIKAIVKIMRYAATITRRET